MPTSGPENCPVLFPGESVDEDYYYTGWQVIAEMEDDQTTPTRQFVYGNYIDEPVCLDVNRDGGTSATDAGDDRYFYHQNTLFSVYGLTDDAGALVETYEYDPYGAHFLITDGDDGDSVVNFTSNDARTSMGVSRDEGEEIANPYTFTGRRYDPETGWHYYRNRYYSSERGRFVTRDPIGFQDSVSQVQYARSNPVLFTDPHGLKVEICVRRSLNAHNKPGSDKKVKVPHWYIKTDNNPRGCGLYADSEGQTKVGPEAGEITPPPDDMEPKCTVLKEYDVIPGCIEKALGDGCKNAQKEYGGKPYGHLGQFTGHFDPGSYDCRSFVQRVFKGCMTCLGSLKYPHPAIPIGLKYWDFNPSIESENSMAGRPREAITGNRVERPRNPLQSTGPAWEKEGQ
ncbi:RHS repeat-associated core domain-containing protein [bacterium]|nr:RHS repeat-associated core domain-containing protein [bacterium]